MRQRVILILLVAMLVLVSTMGCSLAQLVGRKPPTPTPTYTKTPKPTFTPTPVIVDTPTPIPTPTPVPTNTPIPTPTVPPTPTDTPVPTATFTETPLPSPTPTPKPQGIVNQNDLNFRAGPSTAYASLGKLAKGTQLEVRMRTADSAWLRVCCYNEQEGWVTARYIDLSVPIDAIPIDQSVPPTPTPRPATPTPRPQPTPTPVPVTPTPAYYYRAVVQWCKPNCGITYIEGTVYEGTNRVNGKIVRLSWQPDGEKVADYVSGTDPSKPGMYTFILETTKPREGDWYVWIVDASGKRISELGYIHTNTDCQAANACQQVVIDFAH